MRCSRGVYVSNVYPFAGIAFEGLCCFIVFAGVVCLWLWRRTGNHHKIELAAGAAELEAQRQTEDCLLSAASARRIDQPKPSLRLSPLFFFP